MYNSSSAETSREHELQQLVDNSENSETNPERRGGHSLQGATGGAEAVHGSDSSSQRNIATQVSGM